MNIRVAGLLGVGFDHQDRHIRITEAEQYRVIMGSGETHAALQNLCSRIDGKVKESGRRMDEFSLEEFLDLIRDLI